MKINYQQEVLKKFPKAEAYKIGVMNFTAWVIGKTGPFSDTLGSDKSKPGAWKDAYNTYCVARNIAVKLAKGKAT